MSLGCWWLDPRGFEGVGPGVVQLGLFRVLRFLLLTTQNTKKTICVDLWRTYLMEVSMFFTSTTDLDFIHQRVCQLGSSISIRLS